MATPDLPEPERWVSLQFRTIAKGTSKVTGKLIKGGRELIEPQTASGTIVITGEVGITWDEDQTPDGFADEDVTVNNVTVKINVPPVPDDADASPRRHYSDSSKLVILSEEKERDSDELKVLFGREGAGFT